MNRSNLASQYKRENGEICSNPDWNFKEEGNRLKGMRLDCPWQAEAINQKGIINKKQQPSLKMKRDRMMNCNSTGIQLPALMPQKNSSVEPAICTVWLPTNNGPLREAVGLIKSKEHKCIRSTHHLTFDGLWSRRWCGHITREAYKMSWRHKLWPDDG